MMDKTSRIMDRFQAIKAMNALIIDINDETAYYGAWIYVVPDEADDDELMDIAEDEELFAEAVILFIRLMNRYAKHGLYIGGILYTEDGAIR